jgi:hypothetical protein
MFRRLLCALLVTSLAGFGGQFQQSYPPADQPQQYPSPQYPQSQYPEQQQLPAAQGDPNAPQGQAGNPADDMQHGVARLSMVQGDVNVRRGDNGQLTIAVANAPLMARDHLETAAGSRAEVQLDANTIVRLGPNTDAGFATLQYRKAQIQIGLGTVIYRVLGNSETQVEMDTPSVGIRALGPGDYRISVFDNGTSQITVRSGQLELMAPRGTERVNAGQSVMVRGDAADPEMQTSSEVARDQFDDWSDQRDREIAPQQSAQYASPDIQGTGDLDRNGNWVPSGYGQVWHPQEVGPDWSPYSDGQWSYSDYYGWTWVDSAPWGWAPYHYGRWFWNTGYGWCWWPGARGGFNYWSPAMVGFFGWGRPGIGVGVGFGFAGLGWVALAPFEVFHPWWGRGGVGFRGGYALASFRNSAIRGGALTASYNGFGGVRQRFAAATRSQLTGASTFGGRVPVTPSAASYRFSARTPVANPRLAAAQNRSFYRSNTSAISRPSYSSNSRAQSSSAGWQRFGSPSATGSVRQNYSQGAESGWHSFGQPQSSSRSAYSEPRQSYSAPRQSYSAPRQSYSAPASQPRYSAPSNQQRYSAPAAQPRYSAPAQPRYSAPAQQRSAPAPHYSAPKSSGGGGGSHPSGGGHASGGGGRHGR